MSSRSSSSSAAEEAVKPTTDRSDGHAANREEPVHPPSSHKAVNWSKYKIGGKFVITAVLAAAIGQSFLFGLNIGLLNSSINSISWDLWKCPYSDITLSDDCKTLLGANPLMDIAEMCNSSVDDDMCTFDDKDGKSVTCTAPTPIDCTQVTWKKAFLNCAVLLGAAIAALTSGGLIVMGRRKLNFLIVLVYVVGIVSSCVAGTYPAFIWARLIVGAAVGMGSVQAPTYIAEMSPTFKKGFYGVFHQLFITIGILVAVLLGLPFKSIEFQSIKQGVDGLVMYEAIPTFSQVWWRFMMGFGILALVLNIIGFLRIKADTPKFYTEKSRFEDARECLKRVYGKEDVEEELNNIKEACSEAERSKNSGMTLGKAMKDSKFRKVILIGMLTSASQQFSGINVFMVASNQLYAQAGASASLVTILSTVLTAINCLMTFPAPFLIEKLGRKTLLLWGTVGQCCGMIIPTICFWIDSDASYTTYVSIVCSYIFITSFAVSTGPVLWVWMTEIFPYNIAHVATGLLVAMNWVGGIIMVFVGTVVTDNTYSFTLFSVLNVLVLLWVIFAVRETKGLKAGQSPYVSDEYLANH